MELLQEHDAYTTATIIILCTKFENNVDSDDTKNYDEDAPPVDYDIRKPPLKTTVTDEKYCEN